MSESDGKAKYIVLMEQLREQILSGKIKPGEKLPSENELARDHRMSRHTVRKALGILTEEGFIVAEHGKGTYCSERMRHLRQSKNIAVITTYISEYFFPRLIQGIDNVLTEAGYSILVKNTGNSRNNEKKCLEDILTKDIDGLIIEPSKSQIYCKHMHLYEALEGFGIPYVFIQGVYPEMTAKPHILLDDPKGGYLVTRHLIELGHRHILGIFKADDTQGQNRHKGYARALQESGLIYNPDDVIWYHTEDRLVRPGAMLKRIIETKRPVDAIVCYNDQIAFEIIKVLGREGLRVPEDASVTGYDNSFIAENGAIKLTTIAHPQEKLGEMAARLLLEQIAGVAEEKSTVSRIIDAGLIVRESTKKRSE